MNVAPALTTSGGKPGQGYPAIAFHATQDPNYATDGWRVRRLTPLECERLQGFPDNYTAIPGATDTGRYHALGNSMAVPCMTWIGERLALVDRYADRIEQLHVACT